MTSFITSTGNASDILRDELPKIMRAEEMAKARIVCELIYKQRATLKENYPPKPGLGPLALICLFTPSLNPPCYSTMKIAVMSITWSSVL